jgi:sulfoxide reductase heme-binding subunit YedZ
VSLLWALTRSTALVATAALSLTVALGVLASSPAGSRPRMLAQALHRSCAGLSVALVGAHVGTVLADSWVPLSWADGVLPFRSAYRTVGTGLGTLAVDLLAVVVVTSLLRGRLGHRAWYAVHLATYALWPLVVLHGLAVGTDDHAVAAVTLTGTGAVALATLWRFQPRWALR